MRVQLFISFSFFFLQTFSQLPPYPGAGCTFDPVCFYYAAGCTLAKCPPFNRSTPVTCNQCMQMCNEKLSGEYPYFCKAVSYDCVTKTCDMFGVDETSGGWLTKDPNKFYFKPTLQCRSAPSTPAPLTACPAGQAPKVIAVQDRHFAEISGASVPSADQASCARACINNQLPNGTVVDCHSAQFRSGQCTLTSSTATSEEQLHAEPGAIYYQKFCFDAALGAACPDTFGEYPQHVLVGQNRQAVDAQSLQDCVTACLGAKQRYGFGCNSLMFYYNIKTQNCILNDETRSTHPDLFSEIKDDKVTYIEPLCGGGVVSPVVTVAPTVATPGIFNTEVTIGPVQTTTWIGGDLGAGISTFGTLAPLRFLADRRKEALREAFKDAPRSESSVCQAYVYNGLKKCPIGVMRQGSRMRWCANPINC